MALFSAYRNDKQKINKWYVKFGENDSRQSDIIFHIILLEINMNIDIMVYPEVILYFFQLCSGVFIRCPIYTLLMLMISRRCKLIPKKLFLQKFCWQRSTRDHHRWDLLMIVY